MPDAARAAFLGSILACALVGCVRRPSTAEPGSVRDVASDVYLVESSVAHRVVVFRRCDPDPCSTRSYLQWFDPQEGGVKRSAPLEEANGPGAFVKEARWMDEKGEPVLYLTVTNSADPSKPPFVLRIQPDGEGRYHVTCEVH